MGIRDIVAGGVGIISTVLDDMKSTVTIEHWIGDDGQGEDEYSAPVTYRAFVDSKPKMHRTSAGDLYVVQALITFVDAVAEVTPNVGKERNQPIDPRDIIRLPNGTTSPIIPGGFLDPITGHPFANDVMLGSVVRGQ